MSTVIQNARKSNNICFWPSIHSANLQDVQAKLGHFWKLLKITCYDLQMPMSASEVVGIESRDPEGGCYLVKAGSGSGSGCSGHCADEVGGFCPGAVGGPTTTHQPQHHFNVQESTLVISNSSTCTLKLQSQGPFSSKKKNYTVQFNKETTKTTTSSQVSNHDFDCTDGHFYAVNRMKTCHQCSSPFVLIKKEVFITYTLYKQKVKTYLLPSKYELFFSKRQWNWPPRRKSKSSCFNLDTLNPYFAGTN